MSLAAGMPVETPHSVRITADGLLGYAQGLMARGLCFSCGGSLQPVVGDGGSRMKACPECGAEVEILE